MSAGPWKPEKLRPCGSEAAYRRHLRAGERTCDACRAFHNARTANDRAVIRAIRSRKAS